MTSILKRVLWIGIPAVVYLFLLLRVSAFRRDQQWQKHVRGGRRAYFGVPMSSISAALSKESYDVDGRRYLPWLRIALAVVFVGFMVALASLLRDL
jgi:hypothetical protein